MKRSKMLEYIRSELRETMHGLSITNEKANKYFWRRSKELLDMIEGHGMLPPPIEEYNEDEPNYICGVNVNIAIVREWEPEDEEK